MLVLLCGGFGKRAAVFTLWACPNPVPTELAAQMNDVDGPFITITGPEEGSQFSTVVRVSGTVIDDSGQEIAECNYAVRGTTIGGEFSVDAEGMFSFEFATRDSGGTQLAFDLITVDLSVTDWNGNEGTASIQLIEPAAGDIPSFSVEPGNREVTIRWDNVPGAQQYDLIEHKYGGFRTDLSSPYVWDSLDNGDLYEFQVTAVIPEGSGDHAVSSRVEVVPLSTRTLAPWVRGTAYRAVTLEWYDNPAISDYTVERSGSPDGPWVVRRNLSAAVFTDDQVDHDTEYYYRVYPAGFDEIKSEPGSGVPGRYGYEVESMIDTAGSVVEVEVVGTLAYLADWSSGLRVVDISDPMSPMIVGSYDSGNTRGVAVSGSYAYVADYGSGLQVIDISDPTNPVITAGSPYATSGSAWQVAVSGPYAYVADRTSGLQVFDISDPQNLNLAGSISYDANDDARGIAVAGSYAYVADYGVDLDCMSFGFTTSHDDYRISRR